ncbi:calcium-binding protein [Phenylobacterium immobile]|uniref:calcium-binding protein n=1 Tax=Phenylobacterium immobile TaxID=21 RepID=UPI000A8A7576|nr:calcium-binding protein [Phenylobacterium immobile]
MATFFFESITPAQAAAFDPTRDTLVFATPSASSLNTTAQFLPVTAVSVAAVAITQGGVTKLFADDAYGANTFIFPDASRLYIGDATAENVVGLLGRSNALFGGAGADTLTGGERADVLQGNQGADILSGGEGDDTIFGGQGDDIIFTGAGANFAQGNLGDDTIVGLNDSSTMLGGQGQDTIVGGASADLLIGDLGDDSLSGGDGADTLIGGKGADQLSGGAGSDLFSFTGGDSGLAAGTLDRIIDWSAQDRLHFGVTAAVGATIATYQESLSPSGDYNAARDAAAALISKSGVAFVAYQVGADVVVFADADGDKAMDNAVILVGRTLADIDVSSIV